MANEKTTFSKTNFILMAVSVLIIIAGFLLMAGPGCTNQVFEEDIFSVRRIKIAPIVCLIGFITMIAAILIKPENTDK
ncbi:MAG: DUF3098 domain-containing protein [Bacteroidaceae bacterium]|nr:DUF3098 domain-containing protein [Bacteroidaceae bacterium]